MSVGAFQGVFYKAIADGSMEGELSDAEFWVTSAEGTGIANDDLDLYDFVENASVTPIAQPA